MTGSVDLRQALADARRAQEAADYDGAVRLLCEALEREFNTRLPQVLALALRQHPWPQVRVRCVQAVMAMRIERLQDGYSAQQGIDLLDYADTVCNALPAAEPIEKWCMAIHRLMAWCLSARAWQSLRRNLYSCLHRLYWRLLQRVPPAREQMRMLTEILSELLCEPERQSREILREHHFRSGLTLTHDIWRHGDGSAASYRAAFRWPERDAYRRLISGNSASRVLTTIHMGDFTGAFNCLATQAEPGWQALTVVRERDEQHVSAAPVVDNVTQCVLRPGQYSTVEIISRLRRGGHSLCILFDLRDGFGGTAGVRFFGQNASMVKGPAALAIAAGVSIIPFVTYQDRGVHHLEMAELIDTRLRDECFEAGIVRITQQLAGLAEKWIQRFPSQWKFLQQLPLYFDDVRGR